MFDGIEALFYGVGALVLLGIAAFLAVRSAHRGGGPVASGAAVLATAGVVTIVVRDARRKVWSPVSVGVAVAYALCFATLIVSEVFIG